MRKLLLILFVTLSLSKGNAQGFIEIDSTYMRVQARDSNDKETGYISYTVASDRYVTRGTVKQAVKKLYYFCLQGLDMSSVTILFSMALNENGTVKSQYWFSRALVRLKEIKLRYGL